MRSTLGRPPKIPRGPSDLLLRASRNDGLAEGVNRSRSHPFGFQSKSTALASALSPRLADAGTVSGYIMVTFVSVSSCCRALAAEQEVKISLSQAAVCSLQKLAEGLSAAANHITPPAASTLACVQVRHLGHSLRSCLFVYCYSTE